MESYGLPQVMLNAINKTRPCGDCAACCQTLGVKDLQKPYYQDCKHLCGESLRCSIHDALPPDCSTYECGWRMGLLGNSVDFRPDKLGLLISADEAQDGIWFEIFETRAGALSSSQADKIIKSIKKMIKVVGVRLYTFGDKVTTTYKIAPEYNDDGVFGKDRYFIRLTEDTVVYDAEASLNSEVRSKYNAKT